MSACVHHVSLRLYLSFQDQLLLLALGKHDVVRLSAISRGCMRRKKLGKHSHTFLLVMLVPDQMVSDTVFSSLLTGVRGVSGSLLEIGV